MVNCIILGRAESFAYKNGIGASALDGIFQGLGYTMVLVIMCVVREFLGNGTIMGGLLEIGAEGQLVFGLGTAAGIRILPEGIPALGMISPGGRLPDPGLRDRSHAVHPEQAQEGRQKTEEVAK